MGHDKVKLEKLAKKPLEESTSEDLNELLEE